VHIPPALSTYTWSSPVLLVTLPTAAKWFNLVWEFSQVIYPGSIPVGNATLVLANVLTCNKHSPMYAAWGCCCGRESW
jgi:hypothetical protein